jgi:hypothetical protein
MQSIQTKYISATNKKGARIKATSSSNISTSVSYAYELSDEEAHFEAVKALCEKLGWAGELIAGSTKNGYSFVFKNSRSYSLTNN